ncbi:hypothetical protein BsWGS_01340 [Bradybaena similaris]
MSGKEGKRSKGRRNLYSHSKNISISNAATSATASEGAAPKLFQPFGIGLNMNGSDVAAELGHALNPAPDDAERITELMDAPLDLDIPAHAISRGPNPYLDRCMYCNSPRTNSLDGDDGLELLDLQLPGNTVISSLATTQSFNSLKLEIWTCASCRKEAGNLQSFLEANFPQASYELPFSHGKACADPLSCAKCQEERDILEKETMELQENWVELRCLVKNLYTSQEMIFSGGEGERLKFLIDKLCCQDPHQLFLQLESQVREIVTDIKSSLLIKLKDNGYTTPELAYDFTSSLLSHYDQLTSKAHLLAQYLEGLSEHLAQFKVTWELLNKHLFHSIAHSDPAISSSGPTILEQLRQGSVQYDRSKNDPYCAVRKHLLKFQEEMSVVVVIWRDCQQLIENYCQEEVKNTQKQVTSKAKSFISQQRQYLKDVIKESVMDEALSETMRNLMSGHKSSTERILCHNCMRERCTCDECTITHMITCGIINNEKGEMPPLDGPFSFALEHTRNVMDITPPSMSSTNSSSGCVSPINDEDKISRYYECEQVLKEEFSDALLACDIRQDQTLNEEAVNDDIDDKSGDDEEEEEEDDDDVDEDEDDFPDSQDLGSDEPHSIQMPICKLKDADALWEAVQHHHQQQLLQHQQQILSLQQSCVHCKQAKHGQQCPFQPKIDPELSRQLDVELAKSGFLPGGAGDCGADSIANLGDAADDRGSSDSGGTVNPSMCATCQCHACLKQSGHVISASLPLQIPVSSPPAELHLYPHIHGLSQNHQQHYMLDLPSPLMPPIKLPVKLDFDAHTGIQDHLSYTYSDWDNTMQPRPGSLAAQHHHQHHQRLSALSSDLLPPPLVTSVAPFTFDLASHLATHTTHTSTTNTTSAFKSVAGKPLISSILPTVSNVSHIISDGSSVDPLRPIDFTSHSKIPQSCLNLSSVPSAFSSLSFSCPSTSAPSSTIPGLPITSLTSKSNGSCHGPPCSRPAPVGGNTSSSKWERNQHCRKFSAGNKPVAGVQNQNLGALPLPGGLQGPPLSTSPGVLKNLNFTSKHSTQTCSHPLTSRPGLSPHPVSGPSTTTFPTTGGTNISLSCSNSLSTMVNNVGVGTSSPFHEQECNAYHHDDNCDSVDDSCSEKSSSTSTSNQKEGKYCDCCYCEFFGHSNTQVAKTSTNYIEMKDRLRKKLKKRSESKHKQGTPKNGFILDGGTDEPDPLEKKGLDGLLNFINGTDKEGHRKDLEKELTAKAAKRARQKQKKLEEKARQAKSSSPTDKHIQPEPENTIRQLLLNQTLNAGNQPGLDPKLNMKKPKSQRAHSASGKNSCEELVVKDGPSLSKQEINRSSLIIESTRPTISLTPKNIEKFASSQQRLLAGNSESSQHMLQFLNALQQQRHNHQNKNKSANPSSINNSKGTSAAQSKCDGTVNTTFSTKSSSESANVNGVPKQQNECQHSHQLQQHRQNQQQKQQQPNKIVNGKVAASSSSPSSTQLAGSSNHVTTSDADRGSQPESYVYVNGQSAKHEGIVGNTAATPLTTAVAANGKNPSVDSPSAGSSTSASQSPSCGTKPAPEQGKTNGKSKKNKKKNKNGTVRGVDEIFMPKSESELDGDVDDFERELEEFKRFCFEPAEPKERRKISVNVNLKDIFKKKTGLV